MEKIRAITLLSPEVIGKIAAGEVVERPSAAIKELVENSLDAGATAVTVEIREGGISYFRVTDNGSGIEQKQIRLAFERHATSKIRQSDDLNRIVTLGFRGEALASIAAVSKVTCTTRTKQDEHGISICNEGGIIQDIRDAACPQGTTFIVRDLFFNTPVRLKFLKKPTYEAGLVSDLMMRLILSRPNVSFRFVNQGKTIYHSAGDGQMSSAVYSIYGREMLQSMRFISGNMNGLMVEGYVGIGDSARGNRSHQSFFINGRYMKSALLTQALEKACKERVTIGHYPSCVLYIMIPYDQVDVNVHPNKLEIRFAKENAVYEALYTIVFDLLSQDTPLSQIPEMKLDPKGTKDIKFKVEMTKKIPESVRNSITIDTLLKKQTEVCSGNETTAASPTPKNIYPESLRKLPTAKTSGSNAVLGEGSRFMPIQRHESLPIPPNLDMINMEKTLNTYLEENKKAVIDSAVPLIKADKPAPIPPVQQTMKTDKNDGVERKTMISLEILGVVFQTYILVEYEDQLLLIDQHAAHERLLYDQMMKAYDQHTASQTMLVPQAVTLTYREMETFSQYQQALENAGFQVEDFGDRTIQIRGLPMILGQPQAKDFFLDLLDELETMRGLNTLEKRRNAILQQACKHAVKGGERLPRTVIEDLVERMISKGVTPTCPHGRPLVVAITHRELDKRFSRIQS